MPRSAVYHECTPHSITECVRGHIPKKEVVPKLGQGNVKNYQICYFDYFRRHFHSMAGRNLFSRQSAPRRVPSLILYFFYLSFSNNCESKRVKARGQQKKKGERHGQRNLRYEVEYFSGRARTGRLGEPLCMTGRRKFSTWMGVSLYSPREETEFGNVPNDNDSGKRGTRAPNKEIS